MKTFFRMLRLLVAVLCVCALARGDGFVVSTNVTLPGPRYHGLVAAVSADGSTGYSIEVNELTSVRVTAFGLPSLQFQSNFSATYCALKQHCFLFAAATSLSGNALVGASFAQGTTLAVLDIIAGKETVRQNFTGWIDDDGSGFDSAAALDAKHFIVWNGKFFAVVDLNLNLVSNGSWPSPLQHVSQAAVVNSQTMIAYDDYTVALVSVADGSLSANTTSPERVLVSPFVDAAGANVYFLGYDMTSTNFSIYVYNAANIAAEPTEYIGYGLGDAGSILQVTPTTLVCVVGNPVADDTSLLFSFDLASAAFSAAYPIRESYSIYDVIPTGASNQYLAVGSHLAQSWLALMNDT